MSNITSSAFQQLASKVSSVDPSISFGDINIQGNVQGNIVVGNRNVIGDNNVIYEIDTFNGAFINWHTPPPISRRGGSQPPRLPRVFVGREQELKALEQHIQKREAVLIYGHSGMGKTTLMQKIANGDAARNLPDGVFYLEGPNEGNMLGLQDVLQRLFDRLFESNPPTKVTDSIAEANLAETSPLVIIDEMGLQQDALNRLPSLFRTGAVCVTSQNAPFDDVFECIQVTSLGHDEAIQLFIEKSGIAADATTRQVMDQTCRLLEDIPLAIATIANAIRQNRLQLLAVVDGLAGIRQPSQDNVQAAIERSFGLLYLKLNKQERDMLAAIAAAPGKSVDREWLESLADGEITSQALESLEVLHANSPRLRLPEGMRQILRSGRSDWEARREVLLRHLLDELKSRSLDFSFVADELGNILGLLQWTYNQQRWSDVVALGRAVDPYLTLQGLWDAWEIVLKEVQVAARNLKDSAVRAWALHQLGTREIGVGSRAQAIRLLTHAFELRLLNGDLVGMAYTLHNLRFILPPTTKDQSGNPNGSKNKFGSETQIPPTGQTPRQTPVQEKKPDPHPTPWEQLSAIIRKYGGLIAATLLGFAVIVAIILQPSLSLKKQASSTYYHPVGQVIEYSYLIDNPGLMRLVGPIWVDDDRARAKCPDLRSIGNGDAFFDWNESMTCTAFYRITEEDVLKGSVTNTASAVAGDSSVRSRSDSVTIYFDAQYLGLNVRADPETYTDAGDRIIYAYMVENLGQDPLPSPVVATDDKLPVKCTELIKVGNHDTSLNPGESVACTAEYIVKPDDVKNGSITITVRASAGEIASEPQSITVYLMPSAALMLKKFADHETYQNVGENIHYRYEITNGGETPLSEPVIATDDIAEVDCRDIASVGNQDDFLDPPEMLPCTATYVITQADIYRRSVTNTAWASAGNMDSDKQSLTIYYKMPPPILIKLADRDTYDHAGEVVTYAYTVINQSSLQLSDPVIVKDDLADVECQNVEAVGDQEGLLAPGQWITCSGTYTITDADVKKGSVTNTAVAYIGDTSSEPQSVTLYYKKGLSHLTLRKLAKPETYQEAGEKIEYIYFITNDGQYPLKGPLAVKDDKTKVDCPEINTTGDRDGVLDPGERLACTAVYTISDLDIQNGSVTNTALASIDGTDSNPASTTITERKLNLTTSADPARYETAGQQIEYTYIVVGFSKLPLHGPVIVTDDRVRVNCPELKTVGNQDDFLDWNETITCTGSYSIVQDDIDTIPPGSDSDHGWVMNTAVASAGGVDSNPVSLTIEGPKHEPKIALTNTANPQEYKTVGQAITYTYSIRNEGNVTLFSPFKIADDHVANSDPFDCETEKQRLAPGETATCSNSKNYSISQVDFNFGNSFVTTNATASGRFQGQPIISATVTTTVGCPYSREGWAYSVERERNLEDIARWYNIAKGKTVQEMIADLQQVNCMGLIEDGLEGITLYVPGQPPLATISGSVYDIAGRPLEDTPVRLFNTGFGSSQTKYTGANGQFVFSGLEPGIYRIFQVLIELRYDDHSVQDFTIIPGTP